MRLPNRTLPAIAGPILLSIPLTAFGWGATGHEVIGHVAEHYLSPESREEVARLLGEGVTLADVSTWADQVRPARRETAPWHYVNIPPGADGYVADRDCPDGQCVVAQTTRWGRVLGDRSASQEEQEEALKFLVHFVGDLHQPLHCGHAADRGGNDIRLTFLGRQTNLHEVWDTLLIERQQIPAQQYAAELVADIDESDLTAWRMGPPDRWATESWKLAGLYAYRSVRGRPLVSGDRIGREYASANQWILDQQLARAGVRLAWTIDQALGHQPPPAAPPAGEPAAAAPEALPAGR
jgi:hypothetical protein